MSITTCRTPSKQTQKWYAQQLNKINGRYYFCQVNNGNFVQIQNNYQNTFENIVNMQKLHFEKTIFCRFKEIFTLLTCNFYNVNNFFFLMDFRHSCILKCNVHNVNIIACWKTKCAPWRKRQCWQLKAKKKN